jgi:sugar phosphate isomerase/epimerase
VKLSIVIPVPEDAFSTSLGLKRMKKSFASISHLGYDGIELLIEDPRKITVGKLEKLAHAYGLEIPAIGTGPTYLRYGLSFANTDPKVRRASVKRARDYLAIASDLGSLVIMGLIRGKIGLNAQYKSAWRWVKRCLSDCAAIAEDLGVIIALEPINRYETNIINTVEEAIQMVDELRSNHVKLMVDTFHMNIEEASITKALKKAGKSLVHVHVADSNRRAPGMGHLNFSEIIDVLKEIGYSRYLSAEILFEPDFNVAAQKTIRHLQVVSKK